VGLLLSHDDRKTLLPLELGLGHVLRSILAVHASGGLLLSPERPDMDRLQ
jgi:hypothetical protein